MNNLSFKASITDEEIDSLKDAKQYFSDCYLMSSLECLSNSENGKRILKEQLQRDDKDTRKINCYLYNKEGQRVKYTIPSNNVLKGYEKLYKKQSNEIIRCVDISVNEYEKKYKSKPLLCRIADNFKDYVFEYNLPSNFMRMFTGVKPRIIGECSLNLNLTSYKDEVMELFKKMDKEKNYSFIISNGAKSFGGRRWHVYIIQDVDLEKNTITIKEKRKNNPQTITIDEALKKFKSIVGYFDSDLEKQKDLNKKTDP